MRLRASRPPITNPPTSTVMLPAARMISREALAHRSGHVDAYGIVFEGKGCSEGRGRAGDERCAMLDE